MTPETHKLIQDLSGCNFSPGSTEKRFVRDMAAKPIAFELSENQLLLLGQIRYRFRLQLQRKEVARRSGK